MGGRNKGNWRRTLAVTLAVALICGGMSWGVKPVVVQAEETWKATELIVNGDFETNDTEPTGWTVSMGDGEQGQYGSTVKTDDWAANNKTRMLNFWNNSSDRTVSVSMTQTIGNVEAGTYKLCFDLEGENALSGLSISVAGVTKELPATTGWDVWSVVETDSFTLTETADLTISISGSMSPGYWGDLDDFVLYRLSDQAQDDVQPVEAEVLVERVENLPEDFIGGLDVSSYVSLKNSGVKFYDFGGNELDDQGFFDLLASCGVNYIRIRVWNNPFDAAGNGYGGGNNDLATAVKIGQWATNAGMRVLIDFHYSDFWADPAKQKAPKAWEGYAIDEKVAAVQSFTTESLTTLLNAGVDVGMVQVGNETNNGIAGESNWSENMLAIFKTGCDAVHAVAAANNTEILAVVHFANPEKGNYAAYAENLYNAGVDYDVFASSYYPYWHGTLANLKAQLGGIASTYGKKVMVAETSWATTLEDGDGHDNTVRTGNNDSGMDYDFSIHGQALELRSVIDTIANTEGGIGVFYWEAAWLPVQVYDPAAEEAAELLAENRQLWEQYGSGWASSYAKEYDPDDAGMWYGGSAVDNQALFDFTGHPLDTLNIFNYVKTGTVAPVAVSTIKAAEAECILGDSPQMPATVQVILTDGSTEEVAVTWKEEEVNAAVAAGAGDYTISGKVTYRDTDYNVTCTLTIRPENLLVNPGFEETDTSMWVIDGNAAAIKADSSNVKNGTYCLHFWSDGEIVYTAEQTITLDAGSYSFGGFLQGGDAGDADEFKVFVENGGNVLEASGNVSGWQNWTQIKVENILVEENRTEITVGVAVRASANAWGSWDDFYLYRTGDAPGTRPVPTPTPTPEPDIDPAPEPGVDTTPTPEPETEPTPAPDDSASEIGSLDSSISSASQEAALDWNRVQNEVQAKVAEVTANSRIENVDMNFVSTGETQVPVQVLNSIQGKSVTLAFHSGNGVALSVSGQNLKNTDLSQIQTLDLTTESNVNKIPESLAASKNAIARRQISVKDTGKFNVDVNLHVGVGSENAGKYAHLYRYNETAGVLEYCGSFQIAKNGQAMFALDRGGEYLVTVTADMVSETVWYLGGAHTVQAGDNLSAIALRYHMPLSEMIRRNPQLTDIDVLRPGQRLNVN